MTATVKQQKGKEYRSDDRFTPPHTSVYVYEGGEKAGELDRATDIIFHSSGLAWGYGGSGPAQLALAILADLFDERFARDHYQHFKWQYVTKQPDDEPFEATEDDIRAALETAGFQTEVARGD